MRSLPSRLELLIPRMRMLPPSLVVWQNAYFWCLVFTVLLGNPPVFYNWRMPDNWKVANTFCWEICARISWMEAWTEFLTFVLMSLSLKPGFAFVCTHPQIFPWSLVWFCSLDAWQDSWDVRPATSLWRSPSHAVTHCTSAAEVSGMMPSQNPKPVVQAAPAAVTPYSAPFPPAATIPAPSAKPWTGRGSDAIEPHGITHQNAGSGPFATGTLSTPPPGASGTIQFASKPPMPRPSTAPVSTSSTPGIFNVEFHGNRTTHEAYYPLQETGPLGKRITPPNRPGQILHTVLPTSDHLVFNLAPTPHPAGGPLATPNCIAEVSYGSIHHIAIERTTQTSGEKELIFLKVAVGLMLKFQLTLLSLGVLFMNCCREQL